MYKKIEKCWQQLTLTQIASNTEYDENCRSFIHVRQLYPNIKESPKRTLHALDLIVCHPTHYPPIKISELYCTPLQNRAINPLLSEIAPTVGKQNFLGEAQYLAAGSICLAKP